ncbi:hypothetical protein C8R45DRAFT_1182830 [Mycena sanguinolenta]|nr:hypothetical protein C8R45DRAFT_1182830 [Mycena sanguinolenta]
MSASKIVHLFGILMDMERPLEPAGCYDGAVRRYRLFGGLVELYLSIYTPDVERHTTLRGDEVERPQPERISKSLLDDICTSIPSATLNNQSEAKMPRVEMRKQSAGCNEDFKYPTAIISQTQVVLTRTGKADEENRESDIEKKETVGTKDRGMRTAGVDSRRGDMRRDEMQMDGCAAQERLVARDEDAESGEVEGDRGGGEHGGKEAEAGRSGEWNDGTRSPGAGERESEEGSWYTFGICGGSVCQRKGDWRSTREGEAVDRGRSSEGQHVARVIAKRVGIPKAPTEGPLSADARRACAASEPSGVGSTRGGSALIGGGGTAWTADRRQDTRIEGEVRECPGRPDLEASGNKHGEAKKRRETKRVGGKGKEQGGKGRTPGSNPCPSRERPVDSGSQRRERASTSGARLFWATTVVDKSRTAVRQTGAVRCEKRRASDTGPAGKTDHPSGFILRDDEANRRRGQRLPPTGARGERLEVRSMASKEESRRGCAVPADAGWINRSFLATFMSVFLGSRPSSRVLRPSSRVLRPFAYGSNTSVSAVLSVLLLEFPATQDSPRIQSLAVLTFCAPVLTTVFWACFISKHSTSLSLTMTMGAKTPSYARHEIFTRLRTRQLHFATLPASAHCMMSTESGCPRMRMSGSQSSGRGFSGDGLTISNACRLRKT